MLLQISGPPPPTLTAKIAPELIQVRTWTHLSSYWRKLSLFTWGLSFQILVIWLRFGQKALNQICQQKILLKGPTCKESKEAVK